MHTAAEWEVVVMKVSTFKSEAIVLSREKNSMMTAIMCQIDQKSDQVTETFRYLTDQFT